MNFASERREHTRIPIVSAVDVNFNGRGTVLALAVNISPYGLYLRGTGELPLERDCRVAISLPWGPQGGRFTADGRIVRSGEDGTAIHFAEALGWDTLNFISGIGRLAVVQLNGSLLGAFLSYFQVNRERNERDCRVAFGVSLKTFVRVSTATFIASIPLALLPVVAFRQSLLAMPNWLKVPVAFCYGVAWLLLLQPLADIALFRLLRRR